MISVQSIKENIEAAICGLLFLILICLTLIQLRSDSEIETADAISVSPSTEDSRQQKYIAERKKFLLRQDSLLMGSLISKPMSHWNYITRRNPFFPLPKPTFIDPAKMLRLERPPFISADGKWVAAILNIMTDEVSLFRVGDTIADVFTIKDISAEKVILVSEEGKEVALEAPKVDRQDFEFQLLARPGKNQNRQWEAELRELISGDTFTVTRGTVILGIFTVEEIDENGVTLSREGEDPLRIPAPQKPAPPPEPEFKLRGTIDSEDGLVAFIERKGGASYFVRVGGEVEGYKVKKIEKGLVILVKEDKELQVKP